MLKLLLKLSCLLPLAKLTRSISLTCSFCGLNDDHCRAIAAYNGQSWQCVFFKEYLNTFWSIWHRSSRLPWPMNCEHELHVFHYTIYIFNFLSRPAWWILILFGRGALIVCYKCCCYDQNRQKVHSVLDRKDHGAAPSHDNLLQAEILQQ